MQLEPNGGSRNVRPENLLVIESLKFSQRQRTTDRREALRIALDKAAGGAIPEAAEISLASGNVLNDGEKLACAEARRTGEGRQFERLGRELSKLILDNATSFRMPVLFLCKSLQACGWESLGGIRKELHLNTPKMT